MDIPKDQLIFIVGSLGLLLAFVWLLFRKPRKKSTVGILTPNPEVSTLSSSAAPKLSTTRDSWWNALTKTRDRFALKLNASNQELREALEEACIVSDLGVGNTQEALENISWTRIGSVPSNAREEAAKGELFETLQNWLPKNSAIPLKEWPEKLEKGPKVLWFVGVNGVGKTTSIAKLAWELKSRGFSVLLAAGDTFRAAASEQLESWAKRLDIECVRGQQGSDSSSVLFNALEAAQARNIDFVLADSAGRLQNQSQLMEALQKNKRVMNKALPGAPHDILLVLDANTGQNMLSQAEHFLKAVGVTGLILTKLDGSAKGGAVIAVSRKTGLNIYRLGLGEQPEDFVAFDSQAFCRALLGVEKLPSQAS